MNYFYFITFSLFFFTKVKSDSTTGQAIKKFILNSSYDTTIPPEDMMQIYIDIFFKQIVKIDQTNQLLVSSLTLAAAWYDQRLAWNSTEYPMYTINLKASQIWLPDLYVINSGDSNGFVPVTSSNLALVFNYGLVYVNYGLNSK